MSFLRVGDKGSTGHKDTSLKTIDNEGFVCTMELERGGKKPFSIKYVKLLWKQMELSVRIPSSQQ